MDVSTFVIDSAPLETIGLVILGVAATVMIIRTIISLARGR